MIGSAHPSILRIFFILMTFLPSLKIISQGIRTFVWSVYSIDCTLKTHRNSNYYNADRTAVTLWLAISPKLNSDLISRTSLSPDPRFVLTTNNYCRLIIRLNRRIVFIRVDSFLDKPVCDPHGLCLVRKLRLICQKCKSVYI